MKAGTGSVTLDHEEYLLLREILLNVSGFPADTKASVLVRLTKKFGLQVTSQLKMSGWTPIVIEGFKSR